MYVKKREVYCKWLELATWGKKRREIFLKYNFFVVFKKKRKRENILPIQKIVLNNGSGFRKVRR